MTTKESKKNQSQRFIDKARELECDEDEEAFAETVKRIATGKRKTKPKPRKKPSGGKRS